MEIIRNHHKLQYFSSPLLDKYLGNMSFAILDIETLGLNPSYTEMILAGVMTVKADGTCTVTQYFADKKTDEHELLLSLKKQLDHCNYLITYNGKHFDIPFIEKRAQRKGLENYYIPCYNLDLYLLLKGHSGLKEILPNFKQKTVEDYMGLNSDRFDKISGGDSVLLYKEFLHEANSDKKKWLREQVLLHNHDDLLQLYKILPIIRNTDIHRAMNYQGFPVLGVNGWPQLNLSRLHLDSSGLTLEGKCMPGFSYIAYDSMAYPYSCNFSSDGTFRFDIPVMRHGKSQFLSIKAFINDDRQFHCYANCINGFLLLSNEGSHNHMEINMFAKVLLHQFMEQTPFPGLI